MTCPRHARTGRRRLDWLDRVAVALGFAAAVVVGVLVVAVLAGWDALALGAVTVLVVLLVVVAALGRAVRGPW